MHSACEPSAALPFHWHCERAGVLVTRICRMHRTSAEQPGTGHPVIARDWTILGVGHTVPCDCQ